MSKLDDVLIKTKKKYVKDIEAITERELAADKYQLKLLMLEIYMEALRESDGLVEMGDVFIKKVNAL